MDVEKWRRLKEERPRTDQKGGLTASNPSDSCPLGNSERHEIQQWPRDERGSTTSFGQKCNRREASTTPLNVKMGRVPLACQSGSAMT